MARRKKEFPPCPPSVISSPSAAAPPSLDVTLSLGSYDKRLSRHARLRLEALEARVMLDAEANALIGVERYQDEANVPVDQYYGIDGSGYSIVILGSGIDLDHPFFGPDLDGNNVSDRIVFNQDYTVCIPNDPEYMGCVPEAEHVDDQERLPGNRKGHGTLVASIAAGYHPGGGGLPRAIASNAVQSITCSVAAGKWTGEEFSVDMKGFLFTEVTYGACRHRGDSGSICGRDRSSRGTNQAA